jgi:hypothetical protein
MRFAPNKLALIAAAALCALNAFGDPVQTGEGSTDLSGNMQLKWLGKSLPGNFLSAEVMLSLGMLPDTSDGRFSGKVSMARVGLDFHPPKVLDVKLSMPFLVKQGPDGFTGPFGDMDLDICKKWGKNENVQTALTIGFPTGYSAIQKPNPQGTVDGVTFLDPENQPGNGLFDAQVRASYMFLPEWGFVNVGGAYSAGLFAVRTSEYIYDTSTQKASRKSMDFQIARDGLGATNEAGVRTPDHISISADLGIKTDMLMQCFSLGFSFPMESIKIYNLMGNTTQFTRSTRDSVTDSLQHLYSGTDTTFQVLGEQPNQAWYYLQKWTHEIKADPYLTIQYNVEKNDMAFPIFLGAMFKFDLDNQIKFGGLNVGLGFRFPVF